MNNIRKEISNVLGISILENEWDKTFELLDRENRLNNKTVSKILLVILKKMEEMENDK